MTRRAIQSTHFCFEIRQKRGRYFHPLSIKKIIEIGRAVIPISPMRIWCDGQTDGHTDIFAEQHPPSTNSLHFAPLIWLRSRLYTSWVIIHNNMIYVDRIDIDFRKKCGLSFSTYLSNKLHMYHSLKSGQEFSQSIHFNFVRTNGRTHIHVHLT